MHFSDQKSSVDCVTNQQLLMITSLQENAYALLLTMDECMFGERCKSFMLPDCKLTASNSNSDDN